MNDKLFEPIKIGSITSKNRIAFAATGMGTAAPDGSVTDQTLCNYLFSRKKHNPYSNAPSGYRFFCI